MTTNVIVQHLVKTAIYVCRGTIWILYSRISQKLTEFFMNKNIVKVGFSIIRSACLSVSIRDVLHNGFSYEFIT